MPASSSSTTSRSTPCAPCACASRVSTTPPPATVTCRTRPAVSASPLVATKAWRPCASHHDSARGAASHGSARMPSRETAAATCSGPKASVSASTVMRPSTTWNETPWTPSRPLRASRNRVASSLQSRPSTRKSSFSRMVPSSSRSESTGATIMPRTTHARRRGTAREGPAERIRARQGRKVSTLPGSPAHRSCTGELPYRPDHRACAPSASADTRSAQAEPRSSCTFPGLGLDRTNSLPVQRNCCRHRPNPVAVRMQSAAGNAACHRMPQRTRPAARTGSAARRSGRGGIPARALPKAGAARLPGRAAGPARAPRRCRVRAG